MTYTKPELFSAEVALKAIQGTPKDNPLMVDSSDPTQILGTTVPAYEVDE